MRAGDRDTGRGDTPHRDDALRFGDRQRLQEHAVDDAEHQRHGTNAQRQGQDSRRGDPRSSSQCAPRIAKVSPQFLGRPHAPGVADLLLHADHITELHARGSLGLLSRLTALEAIGHRQSEMSRDLVVQIRVASMPPERQAHRGTLCGS